MEYSTDTHGQIVGFHPFQKLTFVHVVRDIQLRQVPETGTVGQIVHHQNIGFATRVKGVNNVGSNETGTASDDNHGKAPEISVRTGQKMAAVFSRNTNLFCTRLKQPEPESPSARTMMNTGLTGG